MRKGRTLYRTIKNPDNSIIISPIGSFSYQTLDTYKALVNAIIPRSPVLAYEYGMVQYYGALDLHIDEYVYIALNSLNVPLAQPTADMLNSTANFASLNPINQLYVLTLLTQLQINLSDLPMPFKNNPSLVISTTNSLNRFTMMGYYSEWAGYGSTRLAEPNQRRLEFYPVSWKQVGYPGPSLGYRALRAYNFT